MRPALRAALAAALSLAAFAVAASSVEAARGSLFAVAFSSAAALGAFWALGGLERR